MMFDDFDLGPQCEEYFKEDDFITFFSAIGESIKKISEALQEE